MKYQAEPNNMFAFFSAVQEKEVEWLWYPYIPYGKITVLQGDPGEGKSTFILNIAALLSRGDMLPDGYMIDAPKTILYQCAEDNAADTIKPRLLAAGADCSKVAYIIDQNGQLNLEDHRIEETIAAISARLCILDPLQSFLVQDGDMQSAVRMRLLLGKLGRIAAKYNCAMVLISHMSKASTGKNLYRSLGSIDIAAIARSVLMISRDEENPDHRYMFQIKSSLAPEGPGVGFAFSGDGCIRWMNPDLHRLPEKETVASPESSKREACENRLAALLSGQPILSKDILDTFAEMGVSKRTVYAAKKNMKVCSIRKGGKWYWYLSDATAETGETDETDT